MTLPGVAGYTIYSPEAPLEVEGCAYTYVMAGNGVFVACSSPHLRGCAQVAEGEVRGLPALRPFVHLAQGPIPSRLLFLALEMMALRAPDEEAVALIQALEGQGDLTGYKDEYREALVRLIEAKLNGEVIQAAPVEEARPTVDVLAGLMASIEAVKAARGEVAASA